MGVGEPWAYGETNTSVPDSGLLGWRVQGATEGFSGGSVGEARLRIAQAGVREGSMVGAHFGAKKTHV